MIDVFAILDELSRRLALDRRRLSFLELNRSAPGQAAVALLVFADGRPEPRALVKATRDAARARGLQREFENLGRLWERGSPALRESAPAPLYFGEVDGMTVLAEGALAGTRMKNYPPDPYFASERFRGHLGSACDWLGEFHRCLAGSAAAPSAEPAVERYRATHVVSQALESLLEATCERLEGLRIPASPWHGDFCTANVVVSADERLSVIDWEYPLEPIWPLADLLYFLSSCWCVPYAKGRSARRANFETMFFRAHAFSDRVASSIGTRLAGLEIPGDLALPLSVASWVAYANRKWEETGGKSAEDALPLIMVDGGACANLELLAAGRERYLPG